MVTIIPITDLPVETAAGSSFGGMRVARKVLSTISEQPETMLSAVPFVRLSAHPDVSCLKTTICRMCKNIKLFTYTALSVNSIHKNCRTRPMCAFCHYHVAGACIERKFSYRTSASALRASKFYHVLSIDRTLYAIPRITSYADVKYIPQALPEWMQPNPRTARHSFLPSVREGAFGAGLDILDSLSSAYAGNEEQMSSSFTSNYITLQPTEDHLMKLFEDCMIFLHNLLNANDKTCIAVAVVTFCKLRGIKIGVKTLIMSALSAFASSYITKLTPQADDMESLDKTIELLSSSRKLLKNYDAFKNSQLCVRLYKLGMYIMTLTYASSVGKDFKEAGYSKIEEEALRREYHLGPDFVYCMLDTLTFVATVGLQCFKVGSIEPILHTLEHHEAWYEGALKLKRDYVLMSNPEPHGLDRFKFLADLKDSIEKGRSIRKFSCSAGPSEKRVIMSTLNDLEIIHSDLTTKRAACMGRRPPFGFLLYGGTGVAKSALTEILYHHYGQIFRLNTGPEFKYTRNPMDPFWSNFNSTQWCINFDDVGFQHPNVSTVDQSLSETIQVINSTNFVPTQADLADKGRTPMLAKLVLASTNTLHLNTHAKFSFPVAVNRRYPYVADVQVKPEYAKHGGMLDPSKVPMTGEGEYPNFWNFTLLKCEPGKNDRATFVVVQEFDDIYAFVDKFAELAIAHENTQIKAETSHKAFTKVKLCATCGRVSQRCVCDEFYAAANDLNVEVGINSILNDETRDNYEQVRDAARESDLRLSYIEATIPVLIKAPQFMDYEDTDSENDVYYDDSQAEVVHIDTSIFTIISTHRFSKYFFVPSKKEVLALCRICKGCMLMQEHHCFIDNKWHEYSHYLTSISSTEIICKESPYVRFCIWFITKLCSSVIISFIAEYFYGALWKYKLAYRFLGPGTSSLLMLKLASGKIKSNINLPACMSTITISLIAIWGSYALLKQLFPSEEKSEESATLDAIRAYHHCATDNKQAQSEPNVIAAMKGEEIEPDIIPTKNFYFHDNYRVSNVDLSQQVFSTKSEQLMKRVSNGIVRIACFTEKDTGIVRKGSSGMMLGLKGNVWVVNTHTLPVAEKFYMKLIFENRPTGISNNIREIIICREDLVTVSERDLTFITMRNLPPVYDLTPYLPGSKLQGVFEGCYPIIDKLGNRRIHTISNIHKIALDEHIVHKSTDFNIKSNMWKGYVSVNTVSGTCGSPMVVDSEAGPIILGIHCLASEKQVYTIEITQDDIAQYVTPNRYSKISKGTTNLSSQSIKVTSTTDLPKNSQINYIENGSARVLGAVVGWRAHAKSSVVPTIIASAVMAKGITGDYGPPAMGWQPKVKALTDLCNPTFLVETPRLKRASARYLLKILRKIDKKEIKRMRVLSDAATLNGIAGVKYCDKMNRNTSAGFPYNKSKRHYIFPIAGPPGTEHVDALPEIWQQVEDYVANALKGERSHSIFNACLKDEVKSRKQINDCKTRVFSIANFPLSLVMRKFLLSTVILMQNNKYIFENAPGMVAQSPEWEALHKYITEFGFARIIAGDYKLFDKNMLAMIIQEAFMILRCLCKIAGYTDDQLLVIDAIIQDLSFPTTNFFNDLLEFLGSNPSGHPLTVIINGIANCIYVRYAFDVLEQRAGFDTCPKYDIFQLTDFYIQDDKHECFSKPDGFEECVNLMVYGDDNIMGVSTKCTFFNHTAMQQELANIGIVYTMADKTSASVPFVTIDDISFLKRTFKYDKDVGAIVAPLEESSITKRLLACVTSKTISPRAQAYINLSSALEEWFYYGKTVFLEKKIMIEEIINECDLHAFTSNQPLPTYEFLRARFWDSTLWVRSSSEDIDFELQSNIEANCGCGLTNPPLLNIVSKTNNEELHCGMQQGCALVPKPMSYEKEDPSHLVPQADIIGSDELAPITNTTEQVVGFLDTTESSRGGMASILDPTAIQDATQDCGLAEFLSRPVQIYQSTWLESDSVGVDVTFNPWSLFFSNAIIQRKLTNYAFLRCDLKLKIMVNASPFYYGAKMITYQPMTTFNPSTIVTDTSLGHLIPYSQRPHVWIYAQNNEGAEMTLPFLYHQQWLPTIDASQFANMGSITTVNYTTLQSANGVSGTGIPITVYAWAENVQLSGPSIGLMLQSDEYSDKPVSTIASAVAAAAGKLTRVPYIGPFMTATRMGAGTIASIASKFGFSNPPVISNVEPYRPSPYPNLASTEISFPMSKLTLDPKNEVSIDPRVCGVSPIDELEISSLVGKESYLTSCTWNASDAADTILFNSGVSPNLYGITAYPGITGAQTIQMTPMAWVSQLFSYWRGDIIFRIRPICSQFHRGRLRVIWDPAGGSSQNIANTAATQAACFNEIIDLSKDTNVEFRIPYNQALAWCQNFSVNTQNWTTSNSTANFLHSPGFTNGSLVMKIVNSLTGPVASTNISVLISVRAADNVVFSAPADLNARQFYPFIPQSSPYESTPCETIIPGNSTGGNNDNIFLVNMGEKVLSVRQLLRRTSLSFSDTFATGSTSGALATFQQNYNRMPPPAGFDPNGRYSAKALSDGTTVKLYGWCTIHPITWVSAAFVGYRGSINWVCAPVSGTLAPIHVSTGRSNQGTSFINNAIFNYLTLTGSGSSMRTLYAAGAGGISINNGYATNNQAGVVITSTNTNNGLAVVSAWYSQYKFNSPSIKWNSGLAGTSPDDSASGFLNTKLSVMANATNTAVVALQYAAIGTDWSPVFFLNVPTMFYYPSIPVAN